MVSLCGALDATEEEQRRLFYARFEDALIPANVA